LKVDKKKCESYSDIDYNRYLDGEMMEEEKVLFEIHMKNCKYCMNSVKYYKRIRDTLLEFHISPSLESKRRYIHKIKVKKFTSSAIIFGGIAAAITLASVLSLEFLLPKKQDYIAKVIENGINQTAITQVQQKYFANDSLPTFEVAIHPKTNAVSFVSDEW